jgi:hypothetical protein
LDWTCVAGEVQGRRLTEIHRQKTESPKLAE